MHFEDKSEACTTACAAPAFWLGGQAVAGAARRFAKYLKSWQEWQGSNLRPPVLETGALPIELHSYRGPASPPIRAVSSIGDARFARAKRIATSDRATRPASRPPLPFAGKLEGALPETPCSTWAFCARLQRTPRRNNRKTTNANDKSKRE